MCHSCPCFPAPPPPLPSEWSFDDAWLNGLADQVIALGLGDATAAAAVAAQLGAEGAARRALDQARRHLAAAEGNHVSAGGEAAAVDAAFDTFDPPIRCLP